jgi:hypothetical protein
LHFLLAKSVHPIFQISEDESKKLASAIMDVAALYDLTIDPRLAAWGQLVGVGAMIYAPRVMAFIAIKREQAAQEGGAKLYGFPTNQAGVN